MLKRRLAIAVVLAFALITSSCGDDSESSSSATNNETPSGDPVQGGEATLLFWAEQASLDPVRSNPAAGSTGLRDYALYGALVATNPDTFEAELVFAESFEPNDTFDTWTLTLKPDITFSDGTPYNAAAVKAHWERLKVPENRSPAISFAATITSAAVVDELTLEVGLVEPNSLFDRLVGRTGLNYVPSAEAVASGHDFTSDPVGAGPFLLESWIRDDRMVLARNPDWYDAPRPYLDKLTIRVATDEEQRLDTLLTGGGDANYTVTAGSVARALDNGATYEGVDVAFGTVVNFNVSKPPFDDPDLRRAVVMAIDRQAMIEVADGAGSMAADNFTLEETPWYNPDASVPEYDPETAQQLINDYLARTGQTEITTTLVTTQSPRNVALGRYLQATFGQLDGITILHEPGDQPTLLQKVFGHDYGLSAWGYPTRLPDPDFYQGIFSKSTANATGYASPEVDDLFLKARSTGDPDERAAIYSDLFGVIAEDLPFIPYHSSGGWIVGDGFHVGGLFLDGIMRLDLAWSEG